MSEYGILGDDTTAPTINELEVQQSREKQLARFSKSKEYQALKAHLESRIAYYANFLPGGAMYADLLAQSNFAEIGEKTVVSQSIITEFRAVIDVYENAAEAVKDTK